jgi:excisionase family DNA binding protein
LENNTMKTVQLQLAITLGDDAAKALAELLGPAIKQAMQIGTDEDARKQARLRASQNAIFGGEELPTDQGLLIDSRQAAKLLNVSPRTLWRMQNDGEMPQPIRIGRAVRWSLEALKQWIADGCPPDGKG